MTLGSLLGPLFGLLAIAAIALKIKLGGRGLRELPGLLWLALALTALAAGAPGIALRTEAGLTVYAWDGSESFARAREEVLAELRAAAAEASGELALVVFGAESRVAIPPSAPQVFIEALDGVLASEPGGTDIGAALEACARLAAGEQGARVVLISDGLETRGSARLAAGATGLPVDAWCPLAARPDDVAVTALEAPESLALGERPRLRASLTSRDPARVRLRFEAFREGAVTPAWASERELTLLAGSARVVELEGEPLGEVGLWRLRARVERLDRAELVRGNDAAEVIAAVGSPRVAWHLCDAKAAGSELGRALEAAGFELRSEEPERRPALIVCEGLASEALAARVEALRAAVEGGAGLLVIGGPGCLGAAPATERGAALAALLPVELGAPDGGAGGLLLSVAIDASGSMGERLRRAIDEGLPPLQAALAPGDEVALLAFAGEPRLRFEPAPAAALPERAAQLRSLEPGGPTDLALALRQLLTDLREARQAGRRLAVLLSDAKAEVGPAALDELRALSREVGAGGAPARLELVLLGGEAERRGLDVLAEALRAPGLEVLNRILGEEEDGLRGFLEESVSAARGELLRGDAPMLASEAGLAWGLPDRPMAAALSHQLRPKPGAEVLARRGEAPAFVLRAGPGGAVAVFGSSATWSALGADAGWLGTLSRGLASDVEGAWRLAARREGRAVVIEARGPARGEAPRLEVEFSDAEGSGRVPLIPTAPGLQVARRLSSGAARVVGRGALSGAQRVPDEAAAELARLEPDLEALSATARAAGGALRPGLRARATGTEARRVRGLEDVLALAALIALLLAAARRPRS